jgi:hypothetical protein
VRHADCFAEIAALRARADAAEKENIAIREKHQTATIALLSACTERDAAEAENKKAEEERDVAVMNGSARTANLVPHGTVLMP